MKRIVKNLGYQTINQGLSICLPLVTSPYISRVLEADGLGVYSYTYSIVNYFTLFAMLGTVNYGSRQIALVKERTEDVRKNFWSIYMAQLMASLLALFAYAVYLKECRTGYFTVAVAQTIWILACSLDINWFFFGIDEFKITVTKNTIIKLLTFVAIFIFVKDKSDIWKYVIIMAGGTLLSVVVLWPFLIKKIGFYLPTRQEICEHIKPNILLFIPLLGLSVYHIMDKTMLGMVCAYEESGYYYNADKIMSMPLTVIMGTGTVMLPKMSEIIAKGNETEENYVFSMSIEGFMLLTIGMAFGISAVAPKFVPIFFGTGYEACIVLTYIFSVIMVFKSLANIIRNQYLIPHNMENVYTLSVFIGAVLNFLSNYLFVVVWNLGAKGACYGTLVAEAITCIFYVISISKTVDIFISIRRLWGYLLIGVAMYGFVWLISRYLSVSIKNLIIEIAVGGMIYILLCIIYWYKNSNSMFHTLIKKFIQKKK